MSSVLGLGLEHSCPWPREVLSSERLSLASDFFCVLGLDLEPCVLDPTYGGHDNISTYFLRISASVLAPILEFYFAKAFEYDNFPSLLKNRKNYSII